MSERTIRCGPCGHEHSSLAWRALPTVRTLTRADVDAYVLRWPAGCLVEVRTCGGCGRSIARTSRPPPPRSAAVVER